MGRGCKRGVKEGGWAQWRMGMQVRWQGEASVIELVARLEPGAVLMALEGVALEAAEQKQALSCAVEAFSHATHIHWDRA